MIILRQNNFSEESNKNEKATKVGKEVGIAGGALGLGALGGFGAHGIVKKSPELLDKVRNKVFYKSTGTSGVRISRWKEGSRAMKLDETLKKAGEKAGNFARTKGGKWAIIGGLGGTLAAGSYIQAKKKDKK